MDDVVYKLDSNRIVEQNDNYSMDVGPYPEEVLDVYRIWNRRTGVLEYAHSILFYAKQWMEMASNILDGKESGMPFDESGMPDLPSIN